MGVRRTTDELVEAEHSFPTGTARPASRPSQTLIDCCHAVMRSEPYDAALLWGIITACRELEIILTARTERERGHMAIRNRRHNGTLAWKQRLRPQDRSSSPDSYGAVQERCHSPCVELSSSLCIYRLGLVCMSRKGARGHGIKYLTSVEVELHGLLACR